MGWIASYFISCPSIVMVAHCIGMREARYQSTIDCQFLQVSCKEAYHLQITIPLVLVGVSQSKSDSQIIRSP